MCVCVLIFQELFGILDGIEWKEANWFLRIMKYKALINDMLSDFPFLQLLSVFSCWCMYDQMYD